MATDIVNNIFSVSAQTFSSKALQVFRYQYAHNAVYRRWVQALKIDVEAVNTIEEIPFLPIEFFKTCNVSTGTFVPDVTFESSGTTAQQPSKHPVKDLSIYKQSFLEGFRLFYGDVTEYCIIGLLPSYLERSGSSLVMMVDELIKLSNHPLSNFYLYNFEKLAGVLQTLEDAQQPTMLIGVTFALLDFAEKHPLQLRHTTIMETGGMKGRKKEMIREEVHEKLKASFKIERVHSEYGMTELLSQAYSKGDGVFSTPGWMKVFARDEDDPLNVMNSGRGLLNVIDLANIHSCSFIATDDVAIVHTNETFEVIGRRDGSDVRGCNLMIV